MAKNPLTKNPLTKSPLKKFARYFDEEHIAGTDEFTAARNLLWTVKLRATVPRLKIVQILLNETQPLSIVKLVERSKDANDTNDTKDTFDFDTTTAYRTLETLANVGIVNKVNAAGQHASYEITYGRRHHHHAVCLSCGDVEDVTICANSDFEEEARINLRKFRRLNGHSLEFFGTCLACEQRGGQKHEE